MRTGGTLVRAPFYETLGLTWERSRLSTSTIGVQAEVAWLAAGVWGRAGVMRDLASPSFGGSLAAGYGIFGVEATYRGAAGLSPFPAVYAELRVPVALLVRAFTLR